MDLTMTVLCTIKIEAPIHFSRLLAVLKARPEFSKIDGHKLMRSINTLEDWGLIESQYEEYEPDHVAKCYHVTEMAEMKFKEWEDAPEKVMLN